MNLNVSAAAEYSHFILSSDQLCPLGRERSEFFIVNAENLLHDPWLKGSWLDFGEITVPCTG
jgi:hypothetical protein